MYKKLINIILSLFLLALFIFPSRFLSELCDYLTVSSEHAIDAALAEDWDSGAELLEEMYVYFKANKEKLYLFLDHEAIEGVDDAIHSALLLMYIQDESEVVQQLSNVISLSHYLKHIERLSPFNLL